MSEIIKDGTKKRLPAIITVNGCDTLVSTAAQAAVFGWTEVVAEIISPTLDEIKANAIAEIKQRRDAILRKYSEKLVIYKPNFDAALSISQGTDDVFLMPNGATAHDFATAAAAAMNMTHEQWSAYILDEWQTLGTGVSLMENDYLRYTYHTTEGVNAMTTIEQVEAALVSFRAMSGG